MVWYKKVLEENLKGVSSGAIFSIICSLAILLWFFVSGKTFHWESISPIEQPSIFVRAFYSALTYLTLGRFLFKLFFYRILYKLSPDYKSFKKSKDYVWKILMGLMFFVIIPWIVDVLNAILSFFYNIFVLILYLFSPIGISLIIFLLYLYVFKKENAVIVFLSKSMNKLKNNVCHLFHREKKHQ